MRKLMIMLCVALILLPGIGIAEETAFEALPIEGAAPYAPIADAYSEDGMAYDDGSLSIRIETEVAYDTNIYYAYINITDPSQLRTALAAEYPSKVTRDVKVLAAQNNAVLAINGEYFSYHSTGYIVRSGNLLRNRPDWTRDLLIIDDLGDFNFILSPRAKNIEDYEGTMREAFSFGPALIMDGEVLEFKYNEKVSCGYPTKAQRLVLCQLDTLSYLIVATEGPEQDENAGLSIPELVTLLVEKNVQYAYNLDGGSSSTIIFNGEKINAPESKLRPVGDIIYFATLVNP